MSDCFDCQHAAVREWPAFTANCPGCMARALAGIKTLPVLDEAVPAAAQQPGEEE